jgi:hypothetical protein
MILLRKYKGYNKKDGGRHGVRMDKLLLMPLMPLMPLLLMKVYQYLHHKEQKKTHIHPEEVPEKLKKPNPPRSIPPLVVVVHPRLPASPAKLARHAALAEGNHFFLKNPNFGFGLAGAPSAAAIHSCIFAISHVI